MREKLYKISNFLVSLGAGIASFLFTLVALVMVRDLDEQIAASLIMGLFALLIVWVASERPNSGQARAVSALIDRLLAVGSGDLNSPAPPVLRREMPDLAAAVDTLFAQVRSNIDNVHVMALYDPVTALPNRIHFKREADRILKARAPGERVALLFIDLDGFKEVNDSLGHAQGDQVLLMVANRLRDVIGPECRDDPSAQPLLARLAGDEFTLLFPKVADAREAERTAARVLAALNAPYKSGDQTIQMSGSIGVAIGPRHGEDLTSLMKAADTAMYDAKAKGRSRVSLYNPRMTAVLEQKIMTEKALREALARGEFSLVFQPQVCAKRGTVVAAEALLRWNHPEEGMRLPDSFIAVAEESSLIVDIGDWVSEAVAATLKRWEAAGLSQRLTFNISPRQIEQQDFFKRLRRTLKRSGAPPWMLELEFTEAVAMRCDETVVGELTALRADGVSIAVDDFGSGYSNLSRLNELPIDRVKIDNSLVRDIDESDGARTVVAAIIHLIHGLGCQAIAEGVERPEQRDVLRAIGCDIMQGFAFAEPMGEAEFIAWTRDNLPRVQLPRIA